MDALPPAPAVTIVQRAADHAPLIFMGFMAVGPEAAMQKLEIRSQQANLPSHRTKNDHDQTEVMVLFPPGSPPSTCMALYREALAGKFGNLNLEVTIISVAEAADGIDYEREVTVEEPSYINHESPSR